MVSSGNYILANTTSPQERTEAPFGPRVALEALSAPSRAAVEFLSGVRGWDERANWVRYSVLALATETDNPLSAIVSKTNDRNGFLQSLAADSERLGDYISAERAYRALGHQDRCVDMATKILNSGRAEDAFAAFEAAQYVPGMTASYRNIQAEYHRSPSESGETLLGDYRQRMIPSELRLQFVQSFLAYATELGMPEAPQFNLAATLEMAEQLKNSYDLVVGNARGGLWTAFCMKSLGQDVRLVQTAADGAERVLRQIDSIPQELVGGRRVLITDKDLVTGASAALVVKHLETMRPRTIGLALNHGPGTEYVRSFIENAPAGIELHYPDHRPECWDRAYAQFVVANTGKHS